MNSSNKRIILTANILFSGIGCQERGFENSGLFDLKVLNTSEISKESVVAYAAVHCGLTDEMVNTYNEYPSREEMAKHLEEINLGYIPEKDKKFDWNKLIKKKTKDLEKYWLACKLSHNLGDISKIEELPYADFWTCSFPCTDISVAGNMKGFNPDSGTRSSLLWENVRLLKKAKEKDTLPKYIMVENVKNLVSKKFIGNFNELISVLDDIGFNTYWSVLNGKDCGVPQNRERVFVIAIRKDIDTGKFDFPVPFDNELRLKDILEDEVDESYYISKEKSNKFIANLKENEATNDNIPGFLGNLYNKNFGTGYAGGVWDEEKISPTLTTMQGGGRQPHIVTGLVRNKGECFVKETEYSNTSLARDYKGFGNQEMNCVIENDSTKERFFKQALDTLNNSDVEVGDTIDAFNKRINKSGYSPTITTRGEGTAILDCEDQIAIGAIRGRNPENPSDRTPGIYTEQRLEINNHGTSNTLTTVQKDNVVVENPSGVNIRIRKLTPKECWILMGFNPEDCDKAANVGIAKSHLYKMAGNGIITNCVELIAEHLYKAQYDENYICTDENFTKPQGA